MFITLQLLTNLAVKFLNLKLRELEFFYPLKQCLINLHTYHFILERYNSLQTVELHEKTASTFR